MNIVLEKGEKDWLGALCGATTLESPSRQRPICQAEGVARASARIPVTLARASPLFPPPPPRPAPLPSPAGSTAARPPAADWKFLAQAAARPIGVGFPHFMRASKMALGSRGGKRGREALAGRDQQSGGDSYPS